MTGSVIMVDCVGAGVPRVLEHFGRAHPVQGYIWQPGVRSYIPWTAAQLAEFPAGHMLTATRGGFPGDAAHARELDVETFDATDEDVCPWLISRHDHGHKDGQIYCDLSHVLGVLGAIKDGGLWDEPWWRLRIAWYWQRPSAPTLDQVWEAIKQRVPAGLLPAGSRIWGSQWQAAGPWDMNAVYGPPDFTRP